MPKNMEPDEAKNHLFSNKTRIPPGILHSKSIVTSQPPLPQLPPTPKAYSSINKRPKVCIEDEHYLPRRLFILPPLITLLFHKDATYNVLSGVFDLPALARSAMSHNTGQSA